MIEQLGTRILGRVSLEDLRDPDGEIIVRRNEEIREEHLKKIDEAGLEKVRDPFGPHLPLEARCLCPLLRQGPREGQAREHRRGGRHHRGPVHR